MRRFSLFVTTLAASAVASAPAVAANSVALSGVMHKKAVVVIDGNPPKLMRVGQRFQGVKLVQVNQGEGTAVVELGGTRKKLSIGGMPVNAGGNMARKGGKKLVLHKSVGGHFFTQGYINGKGVKFMVDTGATKIAMGISTAKSIGLDYAKGEPTYISTANGTARAWRVKLKTVRVKDVTLNNIDAVVSTDMPFVLLGNSFLGRFNMETKNELLVLTKKY